MAHSTVFHVQQTIEEVLRELDKGQAASLVRYFDEDKFQSFCKAGFDHAATNGTCALQAAANATFEGLRNLSEPLPELRTVTWHYSEATHKQLVTRVWPLVDVDQNGLLDFEEFVLLTKLVWLEALKQMQTHKRARGEQKELGKEVVMEYFDLLCSSVGGLQKVADLRKLFDRREFVAACSQVYQEMADGKPTREVFLDARNALAAFDKIAAQFPTEQPTPRKPANFTLLPPPATPRSNNNGNNAFASPPLSAATTPLSPVRFHLNSPQQSPATSPRKQAKGEHEPSPRKQAKGDPRKISDCRPVSPQVPPSSPLAAARSPSLVADTPRAREMAGEDRVRSLQRVLQRLDVDHSGGFDKVEFINVMKVIWLCSVHEEALRLERDIANKKEHAIAQLIEKGLSQLQQVCGGDPSKALELRTHFSSAAFQDVCASVFGEVDKDHSESVDKQECMAAFRIVMERLPGVSQIVQENGRSVVAVATELGATLLENQWSTLDLSSDGELQLNEFVNAMKLTWIECSLIINGAAMEKETTSKRQATGRLVEEAFGRLSSSGVTGSAQANKLRTAFNTEAFELDCRNAFSKADVDDSDNITKEECVEAVKSGLQAIPGLDRALASFQKTLQEFASDVSKFIDGVWPILDWNHSGALDFDEFYAVVKLVRIHAQQVIAKAEGAENLVELYFGKLNNPRLIAELRAFFETDEFRAYVSDSLRESNIGGANVDQKQAAELCKNVMIRQKGLEEALAVLGNSIHVYARLIVASVLRRFWPVLDILGTGTLTSQELLPLVKIIYIVGTGLVVVNQPSTPAEGLVGQQLTQFGQFYEQETWLRMLFAGKNFAGICSEVFQSVDKDQSGSVDRAELNKAFGLVLQWVVSKFPTRFDQNSQALAQNAQQAISLAFATLDSDHSGGLDRTEFGNAVKLCFIHALSLTQPAQQRKHQQPVFFWQQGEHERRIKQERALKIVDNLLVELAKVNEVQADFVCQLLQSPQFVTECQATFLSVDSDRSQSIDQIELVQAFRVLVATFPGLQERVVSGCGLDTTLAERIEKLGATLVLLIFSLVNSNPISSASGRLDFPDFVVAMKIMLLKLLLPDESPGAVPL